MRAKTGTAATGHFATGLILIAAAIYETKSAKSATKPGVKIPGSPELWVSNRSLEQRFVIGGVKIEVWPYSCVKARLATSY